MISKTWSLDSFFILHSLHFPPGFRKGRHFGMRWKISLIMNFNTNQMAVIVWIAKRILWLHGKELMALMDYCCLAWAREGGTSLFHSDLCSNNTSEGPSLIILSKIIFLFFFITLCTIQYYIIFTCCIVYLLFTGL